MITEATFGYFPGQLTIDAGSFHISDLPDRSNTVKWVESSRLTDGGWVFAPRDRIRDMMTDRVRESPRSSRIFGLPHTHRMTFSQPTPQERVDFLVWMLGFLLGMRLTTTEAGFVDATPTRPGSLTDFTLLGPNCEAKAMRIVDQFYSNHQSSARACKALVGSVHCLFLSATRTALEYERFIYRYTALEGCYYAYCSLHGKNRGATGHSERLAFLCSEHKIPVPSWASGKGASIVTRRNETLHEGLFFDEPLGFALYGGPSRASTGWMDLNEMHALACKLILSTLGIQDPDYINAPLNSRGRHGVRIL